MSYNGTFPLTAAEQVALLIVRGARHPLTADEVAARSDGLLNADSLRMQLARLVQRGYLTRAKRRGPALARSYEYAMTLGCWKKHDAWLGRLKRIQARR